MSETGTVRVEVAQPPAHVRVIVSEYVPGWGGLIADRLTEHGETGVYSFTIDKQDGKLHMYGRTPGGGSVEVWGNYCK